MLGRFLEYEKRKIKVLFKKWRYRTSKKIKDFKLTEEKTQNFFIILSGHGIKDKKLEKKIKTWLYIAGFIGVLLILAVYNRK